MNIDQVNETINERKFLELKLKELAFVQVVFPSNSNFLLIKVDDADKRYKQLIDYGVVVRNRSNVKGCENCLRVTVGTPQQNKILITDDVQIKTRFILSLLASSSIFSLQLQVSMSSRRQTRPVTVSTCTCIF